MEREAPGSLELVRSYVNTLDPETGEDELDGPQELEAWLSGWGVIEPAVDASPADVGRAIALREALRSLLLANNGEPSKPEATARLDEVARRAGVALRFLPEGYAELRPRKAGVDGALGRIVAIVAEAMEAGTWPRLKACRSHDCEWAFYDRSKNRSSVWCSMEVCGNRTKVRAYRARRGR